MQGSKYHKAFLWNAHFRFSEHWFNRQVLPCIITCAAMELTDEFSFVPLGSTGLSYEPIGVIL